MKKAWYIEGYTFNGDVYCRDCVAETLNDDSFRDAYNLDEHEQFEPIFASQKEEYMECEYCWNELS
jgi:hypothetical protein